MIENFQFISKKNLLPLIEIFLIIRALFFIGEKFQCSCCGWKLRAFTKGGGSYIIRSKGYCPRCNSKARHRRIWLFLKFQTNLFSDQQTLLHISPKYCLSRQLKKRNNINYIGADINPQVNINLNLDLTATPFKINSFDSVICIHVLEHIDNDTVAIQEIYRILKPGGWAVISVPIQLDQRTYEDPSINTPDGRKKAYGESGHYRIYGYDLLTKFETCGFQVQLDKATKVDNHTRETYGLQVDENIFYLKKKES